MARIFAARAHLVGNIAAEGSGQDAQAKGADGPEHGAEGDGRAEDVGGVGGHVGDADVHAVAAEDQDDHHPHGGKLHDSKRALEGVLLRRGDIVVVRGLVFHEEADGDGGRRRRRRTARGA